MIPISRKEGIEEGIKRLLDLKVERLHQEAQKLIDQSEFKNAEAILDSILSIQPHSPLAYFQLGLIYSQKKDQYKQAEYYFKKALESNKKYAEAYYELGMLYKNGPFLKNDAIRMFDTAIRYDSNLKDAYFQRAMTIMQYNDYVAGHKKLEKLIFMDPDFQSCYDLYLKIGIAFHQFGRMTKFLAKLIFAYPNRSQYQLDLIKMLYRDERYAEALEKLNQFKLAYPNYSVSLQNFYEARILFALGQDSLATDSYWKGINNISTNKEANEIFSDIIFLVTNEEYDQYISVSSIEQKKKIFHIFWKSRDPTLATSFNERLPEHYQRLCYARKHNKRYPSAEFLSFFVNDFSEPLERVVPPDIEIFGTTKGTKNQQEIDDQGIIYIRHGKPDAFASDIGQQASMNVSWLYYPKNGRSKMIFHFYFPDARDPKRASSSDGWRLELFPRYPEERWALDARYLSKFKYSHLAFENMQSIALATSTETCNYRPKNEQFDFPFISYTYKGKNNNEDVYLFYNIPNQSFPDTTFKTPYSLRNEIVIFNAEWEEIKRIDEIDSYFKTKQSLDKEPIKKYQFELKSGQYFIGMKLSNNQLKKEGHLRIGLSVPSYHAAGLKLSNIMLGNVSDNETNLINQKLEHSGAPNLVPCIRKQFKINDPILIYFEIYNLMLDENNGSTYSINLEITQIKKYTSTFANLFNQLKNIFIEKSMYQMSIEDDYSGKQTDEFITRAILMSDYSPGLYELSITAFDKVAKSKLIKKINFEITQ